MLKLVKMKLKRLPNTSPADKLLSISDSHREVRAAPPCSISAATCIVLLISLEVCSSSSSTCSTLLISFISGIAGNSHMTMGYSVYENRNWRGIGMLQLGVVVRRWGCCWVHPPPVNKWEEEPCNSRSRKGRMLHLRSSIAAVLICYPVWDAIILLIIAKMLLAKPPEKRKLLFKRLPKYVNRV